MVAKEKQEEEEEEVVVDWSDVPYHIVELIMNKLMTPAEIFDYVRCGAVCTSWRTVFIHHHHHPPPGTPSVTLPPFLIVPTKKKKNSKKKNDNKKKNSNKKNGNKKKNSNKKNGNKKKNSKKIRRTNTKSLSFYNIIDKKIYNQFQVTIPGNRHFRGSSHGWLIAVDQNNNNCQIRLFNPFLSYSSSYSSGVINNANNNNHKCEILLPSLKHLHILFEDPDAKHNSPSFYFYLRKAVLSADPLSNPNDYIVMAILGSPGRLAYCRPGGGNCHNKAWTLVEFEYIKYQGFRDVIYYKGKFVALYYPGTVVVMDPTRNMVAVTLEFPLPQYRLLTDDTMYLVESAGSLVQVYREIEVGEVDMVTERIPYSTTKFRVLKLWDQTKKMNYDIAKVIHDQQNEGEWKLIKDLDGCTLFLGDNHSMWIHASDYPGCKSNSIYFTDDFIELYYSKPWDGPHDLGVFNLVDDTFENHYPSDHDTSIWPIPIWIQPIVQVCDTKQKKCYESFAISS